MTPLLLLGVGSNLAALAVTLVILRDARRDLAAVVSGGIGNGRRLVARASVRHEWARLATVAFLIIAGAASAAQARTLGMPLDEVAPLWIAARASYALSGVLLAVDAFYAYRARRELVDTYLRQRGTLDPNADPGDDR